MSSLGTVLIASSAAEWTPIVEMLADDVGYRVLLARSEADTNLALTNAHVDLIVADDARDETLTLLSRLRISHPDIIRVAALEADAERPADVLSQASIYQYVRKPLEPKQIELVIKRGLEARELSRRHRLLSREFKVAGDFPIYRDHQDPSHKAESKRFEKLAFVSEKMASLCGLAKKAAETDLPILIQGETGTGKELLARAVHYNSARRASPLMVQNCGGMSDELLHSELFGHKRGAFTGAISDRLGLFRAADGGTVFLDEISEVSQSFQVSLLRFLQEGEVKPIGSDTTSIADVRIIAAANRSLKDLVAAGQYRQDLYFRLCGFELEVPPLRERPDDISALAEFFAAKHIDALGKRILGVSAAVLDKLAGYAFPGNVRELETEIRRMVALTADGDYLTTQTLSQHIRDAAPARAAALNGFVPKGATLKQKVEDLEKHMVSETLARHRWNQSRAADELGLSRVGLANKIRRYGLDDER